jgi:uncharacterized damage-inducible protein DinB
MLDYILKVSGTNAFLFEKAISDIPEHLLCDQSKGVVNHPLWQIGHVALARTATVQALGGTCEFPEAWARVFGIGSQPVADASVYPKREELLAKYKECVAKFHELAPHATAEQLGAPHSVTPLQGVFKTVGELIAGITTMHDSLHLGQLTAWRRTMGLPSLMR